MNFLKCFRFNNTISMLKLSNPPNVNTGNTICGDEGARIIASGLKENKTLMALDLSTRKCECRLQQNY